MSISIATENPLQVVTREAGTDVTNRRFVKEATTGIVSRCSVTGETAVGVANADAVAGDEVGVKRGGDIIVEAGALISAGAEVMTDTTGRPVTWTDGSGYFKLGVLTNNSSAGAAGDLVSVQMYFQPIDDAVDLT